MPPEELNKKTKAELIELLLNPSQSDGKLNKAIEQVDKLQEEKQQLLEKIEKLESEKSELEELLSEQNSTISNLDAQVKKADVVVAFNEKNYRVAIPKFNFNGVDYEAISLENHEDVIKELIEIKSQILQEVK